MDQEVNVTGNERSTPRPPQRIASTTYEDLTGNPASAYHQGKMHLVMEGKKLKGEWILVKDSRDDEGRRWLLIKAGKDLKQSAKADDTSILSRRSMARISKDNDVQWDSGR